MKFLLLPLLLFIQLGVQAQYYYKDIIGTKESSELIKTYQKAGVTRVNVNSYDAENTRDDAFYIAQTFSKPHAVLRTITREGDTKESILTTYADPSGRILKTIDSSANLVSTTEYSYNQAGQLQAIKNSSTDSSKRLNETEVHLWEYNGDQVSRMLRIINNVDTTFVTFKIENGNVTEERSTRRGIAAEPVYYYYNADNQLTDIVRYSSKAKRLLPEYMFEYNAQGKIIQRITVPANSSAYLIWRYQYNADGLKLKEAIYDRNKTLNGKIEYQYSRGDANQ